MTATASNVIAFPPGKPASGNGDEMSPHAMLRECRDRAVAHLANATSRAFDGIVDELYDLAEQSIDRDARDFYLQAKDAWGGLRPRIESRFRERLEEVFAQRANGIQERAAEFSTVQTSWSDLSLVADGDLEESVRFTDIAGRIRNEADEELAALDKRMAVLLERPDLESHDNPLAPMALCDAFRSALGLIESGLKFKLLLIRAFDEKVRPEIPPLYKEINTFLKSHGILPVIRYGATKKPLTGAGPVEGPRTDGPRVVGSVTLPVIAGQPGAGAAGVGAVAMAALPAGGTAGALGGAPGAPGIAEGQDPFAMLQQLVMGFSARAAIQGAPGPGVSVANVGHPGGQGAALPGQDGNGGFPAAGGPWAASLPAPGPAVPGGHALAGGVSAASSAVPGALALEGGVPAAFPASGTGIGAVPGAGFGGTAHGPFPGAPTGGATPFPAAPEGGFPTLDPLAAGPGSASMDSPVAAGPAFVGILSRIQHRQYAALPADVTAAVDLPAELGVPEVVEATDLVRAAAAGPETAPGVPRTRNVLHALKQTSLATQLGQMDTVTLDIVAMLFDQIFGDEAIPAAMKALIGRLQIPMLKVAVLDKSFFSKKSHPARRMLDTLGELSLGLGDGFETGSTLYRRIEGVLQRVLDEFEEDLGVFERVTAELQTLIEAANRTAELAAKQDAKRIQDKERLEIARLFAQNELRSHLQGRRLPRAVVRFLATEWLKLLILAYAKGGRESRAWKSLVETLAILVWSLTPKQTADERRRLVSLLPGLLKRLARGMEVIGTPAQVRERFNGVLMRCHAKAIGGMDAASADVEAPLAAERRATARSNAAGARPATAAAPPVGPAPAPSGLLAPAVIAGASAEAVDVPPASGPLARAPEDDAIVPALLPAEWPQATAAAVPLEPEPAAVPDAGADPGPRDLDAVPAETTPASAGPSPTQQLLEELSPVEAPASFPAVSIRNPFGEGEIEIEEVSFGDLPGFSGLADARSGDATTAASGDRYVEIARHLKEGDWVEFREDEKEPVQARLSYVSPYGSTYVFSNRKGVKVAEHSLYQLTRDLRTGRIVVLENVPLFDRAFTGLVGMLRKGAGEAG